MTYKHVSVPLRGLVVFNDAIHIETVAKLSFRPLTGISCF